MDKDRARQYVQGFVNPNSALGQLFIGAASGIDEKAIHGKDLHSIRQQIVSRFNQKAGTAIKVSDLEAHGEHYWKQTNTGRRNLDQIGRFVQSNMRQTPSLRSRRG